MAVYGNRRWEGALGTPCSSCHLCFGLSPFSCDTVAQPVRRIEKSSRAISLQGFVMRVAYHEKSLQPIRSGIHVS